MICQENPRLGRFFPPHLAVRGVREQVRVRVLFCSVLWLCTGSLFVNTCVREQFCSVLFVTSNLTNTDHCTPLAASISAYVFCLHKSSSAPQYNATTLLSSAPIKDTDDPSVELCDHSVSWALNPRRHHHLSTRSTRGTRTDTRAHATAHVCSHHACRLSTSKHRRSNASRAADGGSTPSASHAFCACETARSRLRCRPSDLLTRPLTVATSPSSAKRRCTIFSILNGSFEPGACFLEC